MHKKTERNTREAKVIALSNNNITSPQIPEQPTLQGILLVHTLEYIDQLLEEHFK